MKATFQACNGGQEEQLFHSGKVLQILIFEHFMSWLELKAV